MSAWSCLVNNELSVLLTTVGTSLSDGWHTVFLFFIVELCVVLGVGSGGLAEELS